MSADKHHHASVSTMTRVGRVAVMATAMTLSTAACGSGSGGTRVSHHFPGTHNIRINTVQAAFKKSKIPLRDQMSGRFDEVRQVRYLTYSTIRVNPRVISGMLFEVLVFQSASDAQHAFAPKWSALLRAERTPWRRVANVAVVALVPVTSNTRRIWQQAIEALKSLRRV